MQCGPIRFNLPVRSQVDSSPFEHRVKPQMTSVRWSREEAPTIQELYGAIAVDDERNSQIVRDVLQAVANGRSPLVLSGRTDHVEWLGARLREHTERVFVLKGGMGSKQRARVAQEFAETENLSRVIVATGSYIGEGFDDSRLDTLFLGSTPFDLGLRKPGLSEHSQIELPAFGMDGVSRFPDRSTGWHGRLLWRE